MICPTCRNKSCRVLETRHVGLHVTRRYVCACNAVFSTDESFSRYNKPLRSRVEQPMDQRGADVGQVLQGWGAST